MLTAWHNRFLGTTRGTVLSLLRRGDATVAELAEQLGLTDNAIRVHLSALERDGLVEQSGLQRGIGKPAYLYRIREDAEALFPKAYGATLHTVVAELRGRYGDEETENILRSVGREIATSLGDVRGDARERVEQAAKAIEGFGGLAEVEDTEDGFFIRGFSCPLAEVANDHPQMCQMAATLVEEVVGLPVLEECERGERAKCRFRVLLEPARG